MFLNIINLNDYIMIEGYISLRDITDINWSRNLKKVNFVKIFSSLNKLKISVC